MNNALSGLRVPLVLALLFMAALPVCARQPADANSVNRDRTAPPSTLACDRNQLTSFNGEVTRYLRDAASTSITIHTDWDTDEWLTIKHPAPDGPRHYFLLDGQEFTRDDWPKIEAETGVLLEGVRAIAWVCLDNVTQPVIDWRPLKGV